MVHGRWRPKRDYGSEPDRSAAKQQLSTPSSLDRCLHPFDPANMVIDVAYYTLQPAVAGGLGDGTVMDTTVHPPLVERLHYEFEDWLGDDLVESFPCFLVSEPLAAKLTAAGLGTFQLKDVAVTMTPEADELLADASFPDFYWLDVTGTAGRDDVGTTPTGLLVVSDQALALLREFNINNCDVEPFQP